MRRLPLVLIGAVIVALVGVFLLVRPGAAPAPAGTAAIVEAPAPAVAGATESKLPVQPLPALPPEVAQVWAQRDRGARRLVTGGDRGPRQELTADAVAEARRRGATVGHVGPVDEKRALLAAIGKALGFPSYYGHNLDALEECLGDLTGDVVLVWEGDDALRKADPESHRAVLDVLAAAPVRVVLAPASPGTR